MQNYYEKMVKRIWRFPDYFRAALMIAAMLIVIAIAVFAAWSGMLVKYGLTMLAPIFAVGAVVGAWYVIGTMRIEFEYNYFNGELDLDVITAKRRRRRVATVDVRSFEEFGKYSDLGKTKQQMKNDYDKRWFMCSAPENPDCYYAVLRHDHKLTLLVFEPSEEMLSEMRSAAPKLFRQRG